MITGFHHAQVTAPRGSAGAVRRFYGQILNLTEIPVPETMTKYGLIWFQCGPCQLHIGQEDGIERARTGAHLAYHVQDVPAWRKRLASQGLELVEQPKIAGFDRFHIRDPFGNKIEIIGPE
jgi:catechol 2,3-dioxygenase-like lactoylglutathione lyase family enzyme